MIHYVFEELAIGLCSTGLLPKTKTLGIGPHTVSQHRRKKRKTNYHKKIAKQWGQKKESHI